VVTEQERGIENRLLKQRELAQATLARAERANAQINRLIDELRREIETSTQRTADGTGN